MRKIILLIFVLSFSVYASAQINHELKSALSKTLSDQEKKLLNKADKYFMNQDYLYAAGLYDSLYNKHYDNLYLTYLVGCMQSYDPLYFERSEKMIKAAYELRSKLPDYDFYYGKALENNDKYEEAIN